MAGAIASVAGTVTKQWSGKNLSKKQGAIWRPVLVSALF
jgi:hypothetical protein